MTTQTEDSDVLLSLRESSLAPGDVWGSTGGETGP